MESTQNIWIGYGLHSEILDIAGANIRCAATTRDEAIRQIVAQLRTEADEEILGSNTGQPAEAQEKLLGDEYWQSLTAALQLGEFCGSAHHEFDDSWVFVQQTSLFGGAA